MVHSSPPEGKALWHIFKVSDANLVRTYIREAFNGGPRDDPIHSQKYYLDTAHLAQLEAQHGIVPFTFYQAVGEAIYIPAGCAHQVSTMIARTKILNFHSNSGQQCSTLHQGCNRFLTYRSHTRLCGPRKGVQRGESP
jgi:hypothetical protein